MKKYGWIFALGTIAVIGYLWYRNEQKKTVKTPEKMPNPADVASGQTEPETWTKEYAQSKADELWKQREAAKDLTAFWKTTYKDAVAKFNSKGWNVIQKMQILSGTNQSTPVGFEVTELKVTTKPKPATTISSQKLNAPSFQTVQNNPNTAR